MQNRIETRPVLPRIVTAGSKQHFFGYCDKQQFDASGRYLLGLECDFIGRLQTPAGTAAAPASASIRHTTARDNWCFSMWRRLSAIRDMEDAEKRKAGPGTAFHG